QEVQKSVDIDEAERLAKKVAKGKGFDLADLKSQLLQLQKMGGMAQLLDKLPGGMQAAKGMAPGAGDKEVRRQIAIIDSMTPRERRKPEIIDGSRRRRIASGSGTQVQDVNRLLKQYQGMQKMMKQLGGGKLQRMMGAMGGFKGGLPKM
ncbi:MAG: signal recognition particle protein, partial [Sphingomonadales bacterium]